MHQRLGFLWYRFAKTGSATCTTKPQVSGDLQSFPYERVSLYSAPSMLSLHSLVGSGREEVSEWYTTGVLRYNLLSLDPPVSPHWSPTWGARSWKSVPQDILSLFQSRRWFCSADCHPYCLYSGRGNSTHLEDNSGECSAITSLARAMSWCSTGGWQTGKIYNLHLLLYTMYSLFLPLYVSLHLYHFIYTSLY